MKKKLPFVVVNHHVSIWPLCMLAEMLAYHFHTVFDVGYPVEHLGEWKERINRWAVDAAAHDRVARVLLRRTLRDPTWAWRMAKKIPTECARLLRFTRTVARMNFSRKTDRELLRLYMQYRKKFLRMYVYAWFPNALEGFDSRFTKTLGQYLFGKVKRGEVGSYLSVLVTPTKDSTRQKEERAFLRIVEKIQQHKNARALFRQDIVTIEKRLLKVAPSIQRALVRHYREYRWIPFDYDGPAWDKKYFFDRARVLIKKKQNSRRMKAALEQERKKTRALQKQYARALSLNQNKTYAYLFQLARELLYLKDYRKDALFQSYYHMDMLIREIGRRLEFTPVQVKHILPQEMRGVLVKRKYDGHTLNERIRYSILVYDKKGIKIFTGTKARAIVKKRVKQERPVQAGSLSGDCAYSGVARGVVRLVFTTIDVQKMKKGDILVSSSTNPNLMPALRRASAIVTDTGGITCHAAIISRELKIPCVIGTKTATKVFRDGDRVEVDAEAGVVRKL